MNYGLGWLPDKPDERDYDAEPMLADGVDGEPPDEWSNRDLVPDILDQGNVGSCVANAAAYAVRAAQIREYGAPQPLLSRKFLYWASRRQHGAEDVDGGTYIRSAFSALQKVGAPRENAYPYSMPTNVQPTMDAINAAFDQRIGGEYRRITSTGYNRIRDIKRALVMRQLVVFGTTVNNAFMGLRDDRVVGPMDADPVGGHAMAAVGYRGDVFDVVNSWSSLWGAYGYFSASADLMAWPETRDLWIVELAPRYS